MGQGHRGARVKGERGRMGSGGTGVGQRGDTLREDGTQWVELAGMEWRGREILGRTRSGKLYSNNAVDRLRSLL